MRSSSDVGQLFTSVSGGSFPGQCGFLGERMQSNVEGNYVSGWSRAGK